MGHESGAEKPAEKPPDAGRVRFRVPGGRFGRGLLLIAVLLVANNVTVQWVSEPFEEVERVAREMRPDAGELTFVGGRYGTRLLGMYAEGRFRRNGPDGPLELRVEITRAMPFLGWRLVSMSEAPLGR